VPERPATPSRTGLGGIRRLSRHALGEGMWQMLIDSTRKAVFVHDAQGVVRMVSAATADEFPELVPGVRLTEVDGFQGVDSESFEMTHFGVRWRWQPRRIDAQHLAWHGDVVDDAETWCDNCARSMFLANVSRLLTGSLDRERTMRAIVQLAVPTLADCCAVVLPAPRGRLEWWRFIRGGDTAHGKLGRYALESIADLADALAATEVRPTRTALEPGARPDWLLADGFDGIGDLVVTPLRDGEKQPVGALILVNGDQRGTLDAGQLDMTGDYAVRAATALSQVEAYATQSEAVEILKADLVPKPLPDIPGTALAAAYRPAQQPIRVGGDFYTVYPEDDGDVLFMLGDVAGSGVEAATLAGRIEHTITALRLVESRPARLLHLLNQAIIGNGGNRFATMVLGCLRRNEDNSLTLVLAAGGHLPPILLRSDGTVQEVAVPGTLVGVLPEPRFSETTVVLAPGETCLLYTDGVTEARGGSDGQAQFGQQRLATAVADGVGMSAEELTSHLEHELDHWLAGREHDDIAMLAVQAVIAEEA
jgi:serine phosphatase RsbU (regulator of sigma subunit)